VDAGTPSGSSWAPPPDPRDWDADTAVTALYPAHYRYLVRTAALLVRDAATAEEVVQDAFVGLYRAWPRLRDPQAALGYLRTSTVNGCRSVLRRRGTAEGALHLLDAPAGSEGHSVADPANAVAQRRAVLDRMASLPERQREVLVLRYYGDWSETEIAEALGVSPGAVKSYASRGLAALRPDLEQLR